MLKLKIKEVIKDKGLTPNDLIKGTGLSRASIFNYLKDGSSIKLDNLYKISTFLEVPISDLIEGDEMLTEKEHTTSTKTHTVQDSNVLTQKETGKTKDSNDILLNIIKNNADTMAEQNNEIIKLEKEIEELKKKVNEKLKERGLDLLD